MAQKRDILILIPEDQNDIELIPEGFQGVTYPSPGPAMQVEDPQTFDLPGEKPSDLRDWQTFDRQRQNKGFDLGLGEIGTAIREMVAPTTPYTEKEALQAYRDIPRALENVGMRVLTVGGLAGPLMGLKPSELRSALDEDVREVAGFGSALAPAAGQTAMIAIQWGYLYPKLFKAVGLAGSQVSKIPQVAKGTQILKHLGGIDKVAAQYPKTFRIASQTAGAFSKGATVGAIVSTPEAIGEDLKAGEFIKHISKDAAILGGVSAGFQLVGAMDTALHAQKVRKAIYDGIKAKYGIDLSGKKPSAVHPKGWQTAKNRTEEVIKTITDEIYGIKAQKMYPTGQGMIEKPAITARRAAPYVEKPLAGIIQSNQLIAKMEAEGKALQRNYAMEELAKQKPINVYKTVSESRKEIPEQEVVRQEGRYIDKVTGEDVILDQEASGGALQAPTSWKGKVAEFKARKQAEKPAQAVDKAPIRPAEPLKEEIRPLEPSKAPGAKQLQKEPTGPGVSLLGGVPEQPPGLTRAEISTLDPESRKMMRAAQDKGHKVGYKMGAAATARESRMAMDTIRLKGKFDEKSRIDAANIVLTYAPKDRQGVYIRRIMKATTSKRIDQISRAINTYVQKADKRQAKNDFKKFVGGMQKEYRLGKVQLGGLPIATRDNIQAVLDEYTTTKMSEKKREQLESRDHFVRRISSALADGYESLDPDLDKEARDFLVMGKARIDALKDLSKTHVDELDADQVRFIQSSLDHLLKMNQAKGDSKSRRRAENLRTHINNARQEVPPAKEHVVEHKGLIGSVRGLAIEGHATIETLARRSSAKEMPSTQKILIDQPSQAEHEYNRNYKTFIQDYQSRAKKKGVTDKDIESLKEQVDVVIGGKKVRLSRSSLLSIYAHTQATGNLESILKTESLHIDSYFRDKYGIIEKRHRYETGTPTLAELRTISEKIPKGHKALLETYFEANSELHAPAINRTSMELENYEVADPRNKYFHIPRFVDRPLGGSQTDISRSVDRQGRFLPRTGGKKPIRIRPFTMEVVRAMQDSAAYGAYSIPFQEMRTLIANKQWRQSMRRAGQHRALNDMTTMMRRIDGYATDQSYIDQMGAKMLGGVGKSLLSVRPSGGLVQIASVPAAMEHINAKHFIGVKPPTPAQIKHLEDISPTLWIRWKGKQYDYATGLVGAQNAFEKMIFNKTPLTDKGLAPYTMGDQIAIWKIWNAAQNQIKSETKLKRGSAEFEEKSLDLLHKSLSTQPQWSMLHRSTLTSSPSVLTRGFTMFMSARNAQYNMLMRAQDDLSKGRIGKTEYTRRVSGVGTAAVGVSVARRLFKIAVKAGMVGLAASLGKGPREPKEQIVRNTLTELKKIPQESVLNAVGLSVYGQVINTVAYTTLRRLQGKSWSNARLSEIRTGNMLSDIMLDATQLGIDMNVTTQQFFTKDTYQSGKRKGQLKWKDSAVRTGDLMAQLVAYRYGLPWEGPKADFIWAGKSALHRPDTSELARMAIRLLNENAKQSDIDKTVKELKYWGVDEAQFSQLLEYAQTLQDEKALMKPKKTTMSKGGKMYLAFERFNERKK